MIAEDNINLSQPDIELPKNRMILLIQQCMVETVTHFKTYLNATFRMNLNENALTQLYTQQVQISIRKNDYPFNIGEQYQDIYNHSKGFSDFYFYLNQQNVVLSSIYSVESKRLPSPSLSREREYVIGNNGNGGIERYKSEKHGKGLIECGIVGFVEDNDFTHWCTTINNWIEELTQTPQSVWSLDEQLTMKVSHNDYYVLESIANRESSDLRLTHLWIDCKKET